MVALIGYTGFVGSNICAAAGTKIGALYNSKNIKDAYGTCPDLLIYAGLRAEKYLANNAPKKDRELVYQAQQNIEQICPKKLVLISTIDVFQHPQGVDETSKINTKGLHAYGYNRYHLECWVRERFPDALIIRLPGLFGRNLKKNFIYDYINRIPFMLRESKFQELAKKKPALRQYYELQDNNFYKLIADETKKEYLRACFDALGFSALNFTDSRGRYQFYHLGRLWSDIQTALNAGLTLWHAAVEPISAGELYEYLTGEAFVNELDGAPANYDYRTIYAELYGGSQGYICSKSVVLKQIQEFVRDAI